ncbi:hypothetical protein GCM10010390_43720 [Streptomyces mordarskii]|uniref:Uncharacterized protein n=1 Tax=Streptomyces mordarskii TaxID=1226758 RepID=A0ABN1D8B6_9ACTN
MHHHGSDRCPLEGGVLLGGGDDPGRHAGEVPPQKVAPACRFTEHVAEQRGGRRIGGDELPCLVQDDDGCIREPVDDPVDTWRHVPVHATDTRIRVAGQLEQVGVLVIGQSQCPCQSLQH